LIEQNEIAPPKYPTPRCFCGEEAKLHVHELDGDWFYCGKHAEEADKRFDGE
jgi:hypothetical protein